MTNRIDSPLGSGIDRRDADVYRINPSVRTLGEIPLRDAGGCGQSRFGKAHDAALRAPGRDITPTVGRALHKVR